ncbi:MAG: hypothetical protein HY303_02410 [Candidatus Wallbacteria bacterium]|nr:hypothetical protein [Candidatus Wallbacteria bacterium]
MTRLLLALALAFAFATFAPSARADQPPMRDWTILGWFCADDEHDVGIEESQFQNMVDLASVGTGPRMAVAVQFDRGQKTSPWLHDHEDEPDYRGAKRYLLEAGKPVPVEKLGEVNMGDPATLLAFLEWAAQRYPARHYLVIFNSHGSGTLSWRGPGSVADRRPGRVDLGTSHYVAYDDTNDDCLTIFEMAAALKRFNEKCNPGRKVDLVAFDSCMAETVEALFELREAVDYLAGTESLMPGEGLNYRAVVRAIDHQPEITPVALGEVIAHSFITRADPGNVYAVFGTEHAEELAAACSRLARELYTEGRDNGKLSFRHRVPMENCNWDLESIAHSALELRAAAVTPSMEAAVHKVLEVLALSRTSFRRSGKLAQSPVGGLSIQWPTEKDYKEYRAFYKATAFAKATLWDEFLDWQELGIAPSAK